MGSADVNRPEVLIEGADVEAGQYRTVDGWPDFVETGASPHPVQALVRAPITGAAMRWANGWRIPRSTIR